MSSHPTRPPILIVEPDLVLRTSLVYQIRKEGYTVLVLGSAALACEVVRENLLSLLIFDPGAFPCEELALCQEIRTNPPQAPVSPVPEGVLRVGDLTIDLAQRRVVRRGQKVDLTRPLLFDLLVYLAQHSGIVLSRTQLLAQVWGYAAPDELVGDTHTVSVHIHWLRQLLETDPEHPQVIQTVRGIGCRFLEEALTQASPESMQALR